MAKKKKTNSKKVGAQGLLSRLSNPPKKQKRLDEEEYETTPSFNLGSLQKALGGLIVIIGILELFTLFGSGGYVGSLVQEGSIYLFGIAGYLVSFFSIYVGSYLYLQRMPNISIKRVLGIVGLLLSGLALPNLLSHLTDATTGGAVGNVLAVTFNSLFSYYPSLLFLLLLFIFSLSLIFEYIPRLEDIKSIRDKMHFIKMPSFSSLVPSFIKNRNNSEYDDSEYSDEEEAPISNIDIRSEILKKTPTDKRRKFEIIEEEPSYAVKKDRVNAPKESSKNVPNAYNLKDMGMPPLSLLEKDSGKASVGDTKANMSIIKRTLSEFGISVEMDEVSIGPSVTRYTLKPAQGVKLSRIANHRQELAYALRAESIRIEAPIPGKALVGIEIPNEKKSMVGLGSLLSEPGWSAPSPLLVALGKGISGNALYSNLAKMPHLLIAGTTGSGKSVMVHAIVNSLLFRNSPEALKFIMVDPKKVELTIYNNIPHLYTPVITNAKLAIRTLNWAVNEMEHRYDTLEENGERDIASYQKNVYQKAVSAQKNDEDTLPPRMPYIVIIIDELADIMMSYPKELEAAIVRLAQKSRAVGIHLILSTQRPSVNVITGLIKANIPSRIALKVASQIDSRTIIDTAGAEQLLGQGDLLFTSSENPKQERVQSAFVSDNEVKRVVEYLKKTYRDRVPDEINIDADNKGGAGSALFSTELGSVGGGDTDDELFEEARDIVISSKKASTSYLQRRLKIGYSRAARLMDMLEERGIIGPGDGAKPREILGLYPSTEESGVEEE